MNGKEYVSGTIKNERDIPDWAAKVSGCAGQAVQDMANAGILVGTGDGYFRPGESMTAGQTAVVLDRIIRTFIL